MSAVLGGLSVNGKLIVIGSSNELLQVPINPLLFCDSADSDVPWKKVTRGLPESHSIMIAVLVDCFSIVHSIPRFLVEYIVLQFLDLLFLRFFVRA